MFETYGNQTGVIKSPISRPYWIENDDQGRLVFNEQAANNISVMDPRTQSLIEYHVPSKNPNWGDCDSGVKVLVDCGIAQIFDFTTFGEKIWFTEWVENKIGVVDTSVPLPLEIQFEYNTLNLLLGTSTDFHFIVSPQFKNNILELSSVVSTTHDFLTVDFIHDSVETFELNSDDPVAIYVKISTSDDALPGTYKILLGVESSDVTIGKFLTVIIE
jgi:virginiamycin B lyase